MSVNAMPGTGKTTVALQCFLAPEWSRPLYLTFNRSSCNDAKKRVAIAKGDGRGDPPACEQEWADNGMLLHTFHSVISTLYGVHCSNDVDLLRFLATPCEPVVTDIDAVIVDEAQDMRVHFARVVSLVLSSCCKASVPVLLVGNVEQTVHAYHAKYPASPHFLQHAHTLLGFDFQYLTLQHTFRMTDKAAHAITAVSRACGMDRVDMKSGREGHAKPFRLACVTRTRIVAMIQGDVRTGRERGEQVAVLFNTVQGDAANRISAALHACGVRARICYSGADVEEASRDRGVGAVLLSYCLAKGLEWSSVYVHCSHSTLWERHRVTEKLPNSVFVALTRARVRCTVWWSHDGERGPYFARHLGEAETTCVPSRVIMDTVPTEEEFDTHATACNLRGRVRRARTIRAETLATRIDAGCLPVHAFNSELVPCFPDTAFHGRPFQYTLSRDSHSHMSAARSLLATILKRRTNATEKRLRAHAFKRLSNTRRWWKPHAWPWPDVHRIQQELCPRGASQRARTVQGLAKIADELKSPRLGAAAILPSLATTSNECTRYIESVMAHPDRSHPHIPLFCNFVLGLMRLSKSTGIVSINYATVKHRVSVQGAAFTISFSGVRMGRFFVIPISAYAPTDPGAASAIHEAYLVQSCLKQECPGTSLVVVSCANARLFEARPLDSPVDWVNALLVASGSARAPAAHPLSVDDIKQLLHAL